MGLLDVIRGELERRRRGADPLMIFISGGLPDTEPTEASFGETVLQRQAGETLDAFVARARAAAKQAGAEGVVIGGLPEGA